MLSILRGLWGIINFTNYYWQACGAVSCRCCYVCVGGVALCALLVWLTVGSVSMGGDWTCHFTWRAAATAGKQQAWRAGIKDDSWITGRSNKSCCGRVLTLTTPIFLPTPALCTSMTRFPGEWDTSSGNDPRQVPWCRCRFTEWK